MSGLPGTERRFVGRGVLFQAARSFHPRLRRGRSVRHHAQKHSRVTAACSCRERTPIGVTRSRSSSDQPTSRTLSERSEYWDIERKRYPQDEHTAAIVAEDIAARFLNVISLLNGRFR